MPWRYSIKSSSLWSQSPLNWRSTSLDDSMRQLLLDAWARFQFGSESAGLSMSLLVHLSSLDSSVAEQTHGRKWSGWSLSWRQVRKETGSHVLGSWNRKVRANRGLNRVREAAVAAVCNCVMELHTALTPSVLLGMFRCVFILVTGTVMDQHHWKSIFQSLLKRGTEWPFLFNSAWESMDQRNSWIHCPHSKQWKVLTLVAAIWIFAPPSKTLPFPTTLPKTTRHWNKN